VAVVLVLTNWACILIHSKLLFTIDASYMNTKRHQKQESSEQRESRIPHFATVEEEAEFWDTHSFEDFADEIEPATDAKFVRARHTRAITVRLEEETYKALSKEAQAKGVGTSTLTRMLLLEHLQKKDTSKSA
jgi:predicted DNA binding CopG/RHH family protein